MAYKVVLSNRFSQKLAKTYAHLEKNFSLEVTKATRLSEAPSFACSLALLGIKSMVARRGAR